MRKGLIYLTAAVFGLAVVSSVQALPSGYVAAGTVLPGIGAVGNTGPQVIINYDGSTFTVTTTGSMPFDGSDDTYYEIENTSTSTILDNITLSSPLNTAGGLFAFDGDGIDTFSTAGNPVVGNSSDTTGYGGPESFFSAIAANHLSGTVNFLGGIQPGEETFFSLEQAITGVAGGTGTGLQVTSPDACSTMALMSGALVGLGAFRRRLSK